MTVQPPHEQPPRFPEVIPLPTPPLGLANDGFFYEYDAATKMLNRRAGPGDPILESLPFATEAEAAQHVADSLQALRDNHQQVIDYLGTARAENDAFLAKPNNSIVLIDVVRQVKELTKQNNRIMRLLRNDMSGSD